ncbi:response regulator [Paraburkholderia panacisoli]|uniref:histidine kinase n=1 Tax=Paraburkholderia panacisoli TaxID=2603818 RepID=A0A5B0GMA3_9BURK|nr:ATP-binding protein [Paraburkholderia panacisoli]KAA1004382.1 response regulator [Paraburkholderia panacisoli]
MKATNMPHRSPTSSLSLAPPSRACGIDDVRAALLQSEMRYRILLDDFPVAVYCCDANGKLTLFNDAAVQLWGRSPKIGMDSWCGAHRMFTIDGHPLPLDRCPMALTLLEQQDIDVAEAIVERPDGSRRNVLAHPRLLAGPNGEALGAINIVIDITERKRLEEQLKDADRRKDEFLAMLAHELRNPLAPVRSAVEVLKAGRSSDVQISQAVRVIDRQATYLTSIVDDLLDVARIRHQRVTLNKTSVELAEVLAGAIDVVAPEVAMRGLRLTVEQPTHPVLLHCDRTRLDQMIGNLLNNAAKYNRAKGAIFLCVTVEGKDLVVTVRDTGIGIKKAILDQVFDLFTQGQNGSTQQNGGLGIGLSVVKAMAEMHGGSISADSDGEGCGSEFCLRLPIVTTDAQLRLVVPVVDVDRPQTIMIVDDNPDAADAMKMLLEIYGHQITLAGDADEALLAARSAMPDVFLIDIGLPGMDGNALASELRALPSGRRPRMIAVTGFGQPEDRQRSLAAGFDDHLIKPVCLTPLLKSLVPSTGPNASG